MPDILSCLAIVFGASKTPENKPLALDYVWLASEVVITDQTRKAFSIAYTTDYKFGGILYQL